MNKKRNKPLLKAAEPISPDELQVREEVLQAWRTKKTQETLNPNGEFQSMVLELYWLRKRWMSWKQSSWGHRILLESPNSWHLFPLNVYLCWIFKVFLDFQIWKLPLILLFSWNMIFFPLVYIKCMLLMFSFLGSPSALLVSADTASFWLDFVLSSGEGRPWADRCDVSKLHFCFASTSSMYYFSIKNMTLV